MSRNRDRKLDYATFRDDRSKHDRGQHSVSQPRSSYASERPPPPTAVAAVGPSPHMMYYFAAPPAAMGGGAMPPQLAFPFPSPMPGAAVLPCSCCREVVPVEQLVCTKCVESKTYRHDKRRRSASRDHHRYRHHSERQLTPPRRHSPPPPPSERRTGPHRHSDTADHRTFGRGTTKKPAPPIAFVAATGQPQSDSIKKTIEGSNDDMLDV